MEEAPRISPELYSAYEFAPYRQPYDLSDLHESIVEYLALEEDEDSVDVHDAVIEMSNGWLESDRCLGAESYVLNDAYAKNEFGEFTPMPGITTGAYRGITAFPGEQTETYNLYHCIELPRAADQATQDAWQNNRMAYVPLGSPHLKVYPRPAFNDMAITEYVEEPAAGEYQTAALHAIYEQIKSLHPADIDLLLTSLLEHYEGLGAKLAFETREAFIESNRGDQFICSTNMEKPLLFRGTILSFYEMDDYELVYQPHSISFKQILYGQKILGVAVEATTKHSAKPVLVKIPLLRCDSISALKPR